MSSSRVVAVTPADRPVDIGAVEAQRSTRRPASPDRRPLDAAWAAIDALDPDARIFCLSWWDVPVGPPPLLVLRLGPDRFVPPGAPAEEVYPDDEVAAWQAWTSATNNQQRVAEAVVRLRGTEDVPTWHRLRFIDLLSVPDSAVVVVGAEPSLARPIRIRGEGRSWFRSSADFHVRINNAGLVLETSASIENVLGLSPDDIVGRPAVDLIHIDDLIHDLEAWASLVLDEGGVRTVRHRMRTDHGGWRWIESTNWNLLGDVGVNAVVSECRDIEGQVLAETELRESEEQFRTLAESFPTGVVMTTRAGEHVYSNQQWRDILGITDDTLGRSWLDIVHPDDRHRLLKDLAEGQTGEQLVHQSFRIIRATDRAVRHCRGVTRHLRDANGEVTGSIGSLHDISDEIEAEHENRQLLQIIEETSDAVLLLSRTRRVLQANGAARRMFGTIIDLSLDQCMTAETSDKVLAMWPADSEAGRSWRGEVEMVDRHSHLIPMSMLLQSHADASGRVAHLSVTLRDITEQKTVEFELARQARRDTLTGLPNRLAIMELLRDAQARMGTGGSKALGVLFIDLDNLKVVNDSLGHGAGDELLVAMAHRLADGLRPHDVLGRFGGDEFVVICPDLSSPRAAVAVAERVLATVRRTVNLPGTEVQLSASIGVAVDAGEGFDPEALIRDADTAMYEAKRRGRNRAIEFDAELRQRVTHRLRLENQLRDAVGTSELELWFQPVVDTETLQVRGVEGLLRWMHPELGLIGPDEFIPLAEETGLIVPVGYEVLTRALDAASILMARHPEDFGSLNVGVNLSGRQFSDPHCAQRLLDIIAASRVPIGNVTLELTESVLLDHLDEVDTSLRRLRDAGLQLALDDFGCGYSSLSYLRRYPVQVLKLDTSYVHRLCDDDETRVITETITTMARRLGLMVIAEGVETDEQLDVVRELGITRAQGFLLGRPAPADLLRPSVV